MNSPNPLISQPTAKNHTRMTTLKPFNKKLVTKTAAIEVDDLLLDIFLCLPLHSIRRFKTACKRWHSLINNPTFRKLWCKQNLKPSTGLILLTRVPKSIQLVPFSPIKPPTLPSFKNKLKIKQSCNGLLLCLTKTRYHVYNPTTDTCHTLPELGGSIVFPGTRIHTMSLAYDPYRFGPHYKVICCVTRENSKCPLNVHVFSSDTGVWKSIFALGYTRRVTDNGVYWNGSILWMYALTYFDIEDEKFNVMPGPPAGSQWRMHYYFGESCGRLSCAKLWKTEEEGESPSVIVYELKRDYSEWVLKYSVKLDDLSFVTSVVSVVHGVEENDSFLVLKTGKGIVRYNLVSETSEVLPLSLTCGTVDRAFQYIESQCRV